MQPAGTDLEFSALLERTQSGNVLYRNADRGGSDTPLEGDLNIGPDDTEISRILWSTNRFILNDNDNPVTLSLADYFKPDGDGNDLTLHVQTLDEGPASPLMLPLTIRETIKPGTLLLDSVQGQHFLLLLPR